MNTSGNNKFKNLSGMSLLGLLALTASISAGGLLLAGCGGGGGGHAGGSGSTNEPPPPPPPPQTTFTIDIDSPSEVPYGALSTFSVVPADAAGTITYSLESAPQGMTIDSATGVISWTPSGLRFASYADYTFTVVASDGIETTNDSATVTVNAGSNAAPIVRSTVKVPTSDNEIFIADFDGDGENEIISTDNNSLVYTLHWNATTMRYDQTWVYPFALTSGKVDAIAVGDVNGDSHVDIAVLMGGVVSVIDGVQKRILYSTEIDGSEGKALSIADLDQDGDNEIVALVSSGASETVTVLAAPTSGSTLTTLWATDSGDFGGAMAVGNVDADAQLEIVLKKATVIDSSTHLNQWTGTSAANFGDVIRIANVNGSGTKEIVGLRTDEHFVVVYSAELNSGLFALNNLVTTPETSSCSLTTDDRDNDGVAEIILGVCDDDGTVGANSEYIAIYNILSGASSTASFHVQLLVKRPASTNDQEERLQGGFRSMVVGDANNDSVNDLMWVNQFTDADSEASDIFNVWDFSYSGTFDPDNPYTALTMTNLVDTFEISFADGNFLGAVDTQVASGVRRGMFATYTDHADDVNNSFGDYLVALDFDSLQLSIASAYVGHSTDRQSIVAVKSADFWGRGYDQIVVSTNDKSGSDDVGFYGLIDLFADDYARTYGIVADNINGPIAVDDINIDGHPDVIGFLATQLFSFDMYAGISQFQSDEAITTGLWTSIPDYEGPVDAQFINLDTDDESELLLLSSSELLILDRDPAAIVGGDQFFTNIFVSQGRVSGSNLTAVEVMDIDGDGTKEIFVADGSGPSTIKVVSRLGVELGEIDVDGTVDDMVADAASGQLLIAWSVDGAAEGMPKTTYVSAYDGSAVAGLFTEIYRSPGLIGRVMLNSMNFTSDNKLLIGTQSAIYLVQ